jgi:cell division septum initiation protein DivIVA
MRLPDGRHASRARRRVRDKLPREGPLNDNWIKDRVKGLYKETSTDEERVAEPDEDPMTDPPGASRNDWQQRTEAHPAGDVQRTLHVLALAQRTAEEHVAGAQRQADKIHADARATADQILRDARAQADAVRREADKALSDARAGAAQTAKDAQAHADNARRDGDKIVSEARARAAKIAGDAQGHADRLAGQARERYEEMVGNLAARREALQQQIEALQEFDRDYRARLLTFVHGQLRALWVDEPHVGVEIEQPAGVASAQLLPAHQPDSGATQHRAQGM